MQTWRIKGICVSLVAILKAYWKDIGKKMIGCNVRNKCLRSRTFSLQGKAKRLGTAITAFIVSVNLTTTTKKYRKK